MNLSDIINQVLEEENVAGGPTSALVTPDSISTPSQFSGPSVYGDPGDSRRAKLLFKKIQKRPGLQKRRKRKKK